MKWLGVLKVLAVSQRIFYRSSMFVLVWLCHSFRSLLLLNLREYVNGSYDFTLFISQSRKQNTKPHFQYWSVLLAVNVNPAKIVLFQNIDELLLGLASMGFEFEDCQLALEAGNKTLESAVEW